MKILGTGSTGLVGTALVNVLARDGNTVCRLMRPQSKSPASSKDGFDVAWNPATGELGGADVGVVTQVYLARAFHADRAGGAVRNELPRRNENVTTRAAGKQLHKN